MDWKEFKDRVYIKRKALIFPLLFLIFPVVFTKKTVEIINALLVGPLLSSVESSNYLIDFLCLVAGVLVMIVVIRKGIKLVRLSIIFEAYILGISFMYLFFRFSSRQEFEFVTFKASALNSIALTDAILSFLIGWIVYQIIFYFKTTQSISQKQGVIKGFYVDSAKVLSEENDELGRLPFINELKNRILATSSGKHSFSIGIVGPWGAGKTTFLKTLEKEFETESNLVQLHFNPWSTGNVENITAIFFSDLSKKLAQFDEILKYDVIQYSNDLLQIVDSSAISSVRKIFQQTMSEQDLTDQFKNINSAISRLRKRIVVYVDDVDRLHEREIIEVLRIIRNTANFGNVFFIVGFDKVYVSNALVNVFGGNTETYLEKIFQLEYYLPIEPNRLIYKNAVLKSLRDLIIDNRSKAVLDAIENPPSGGLFSGLEVLPDVVSYIKNFRDVERFMNVFILNFERIKNNIYLPDFISISILRFKYPEVYKILYYNRSLFLHTTADDAYRLETGPLFVRYRENEAKELRNTPLYDYLKKNIQNLAFAEREIDKVSELILSIFGFRPTQDGLAGKRSLYNHHLTITNGSYFYRYFDFSMHGRLDQQEFDNAILLPIDKLNEKLKEWNSSKSLSTDLLVKFENLEKLSSKSEFEKVIAAMIFVSYLPVPNNPRYSHSFSFDDFHRKLRNAFSDEGSVGHNLLYDNVEEFQQFFKTLFLLYPESQVWGFIHEFTVDIIKNRRDFFGFTVDELKGLLRDGFIAMAQRSTRVTERLMAFYNHAIRLFQNELAADTIEPIGDGTMMSKELQKVISADVCGFLRWNIYRNGSSNSFSVGGWDKVIFGSREVFHGTLDRNDPVVKEYLEFAAKQEVGKGPIDYDFKHIDLALETG